MSPTKTIGILFQAEMVRAILDSRKTLTSRLQGLDKLNESPNSWQYNGIGPGGVHVFENTNPLLNCGVEWIKSPYGQAGDVLVGREEFYCDDYRYPSIPADEQQDPDWRNRMLYYRADGADLCQQIPECDCSEAEGCWRRSIHMPYWASRLLLPVVRVWPSRLQDMTEEMAIQEGAGREFEIDAASFIHGNHIDFDTASTHLLGFKHLWDRINGETHPWASNPWVWRVSFRFSDES